MTYYFDKVIPWIAATGDQLGKMFGIKVIYGWRDPRYSQFPDHPSGHALDFMTTSGTALAEYARTNAQTLGVKYIVWNRHVWSAKKADQGWRPYTSTPNPHTDHVHITFNDAPPVGGKIIDTIENVGSSTLQSLFNIDEFMGKLQGTTITFIGALLGVGLIAAGFWVAVQQHSSKSIKTILGR